MEPDRTTSTPSVRAVVPGYNHPEDSIARGWCEVLSDPPPARNDRGIVWRE